ncbi:hypothetical protein HS125_02620 [bacterium]|nr:hypothetical protein [bacterium]
MRVLAVHRVENDHALGGGNQMWKREVHQVGGAAADHQPVGGNPADFGDGLDQSLGVGGRAGFQEPGKAVGKRPDDARRGIVPGVHHVGVDDAMPAVQVDEARSDVREESAAVESPFAIKLTGLHEMTPL